MKTIVLVLFFSLFSIAPTFSRTIIIEYENIGQHGYNVVKEKHEDAGWFSSSVSKLVCVDKGNIDGFWNINPRKFPDMFGPNGSNPEWEDLKDYADNQIAKGNNSGTFINNIELDNDLWFRDVKWSSEKNRIIKITINIRIAE
ncbi:MAG: hypothetical protein A2X64_00685 [Ignavibacteria bacterium GWF2_33_9]|nr:MAG: hypothetical protein A2X64_00685 [Ignavibacteria bacterium GWF2_33_9]